MHIAVPSLRVHPSRPLPPAQRYSSRQTILHNICLHGSAFFLPVTATWQLICHRCRTMAGLFVIFKNSNRVSQHATAMRYGGLRVKGFVLHYVLIFIGLRFLSSCENDSYYFVHLIFFWGVSILLSHGLLRFPEHRAIC